MPLCTLRVVVQDLDPTLHQSSTLLDCRYHKRVWKWVLPRELQPRYANVHALQRSNTGVVDSTVHHSLLGVCIAVSTVASALMFSTAPAAVYHAYTAGMNACRSVPSPARNASLLQSPSLLMFESEVHVHAMRVTTQSEIHKLECYACMNGMS